MKLTTNTSSLTGRSVAHLTKNQLNRRGGVSQQQISGKTRYNLSNKGATSAGNLAGGAANPNVQTATVLAGAVPNTTRRRYVVK